MPSDQKLIALHERIDRHLNMIARLFTQRPKITIVIRTPWLDEQGKDGGVVLTDDDLDLAIAEINKFKLRLLYPLAWLLGLYIDAIFGRCGSITG
jgi:hypothetical protein